MRCLVGGLFFVTCWLTSARADFVVSLDPVGSQLLLPNTANQAVDIFISGVGVGANPGISGGMNLRMVIGDGIGGVAEFAFNGATFQDGPGGTDYLFDPVTVFVSGVGTPRGADVMLGSSDVTILSGGPVSPRAGSVLARIFVDTSNFSAGSFAFTIDGTRGAPAGLEGSSLAGTTTPVSFINGSLMIVVPEAGSFAMLSISLAAGFGFRRKR